MQLVLWGGEGGYLFVISGESELAVTGVCGITTALNVKPVSNYKSKFTHLHIQISEIRAKQFSKEHYFSIKLLKLNSQALNIQFLLYREY